MKKLLVIVLAVISFYVASASHISGGEMLYQYLGPGAPGFKNYRITLRLFRDNSNTMGAPLPAHVWIGIFDYGTKQHYPSTQQHHLVNITSGPTPVTVNVSPCITGAPNANYSVAEYSFTISLPDNAEGYICQYQTCCRVDNLANVFHPGGVGGTGSSYVCRIPGTTQLPSGTNSSPRFTTSLDVVCFDKPFAWNFGALDPDGDSLAYVFTAGYDKTTATNSADAEPTNPSSTPPPDYPLLIYINGYTAAQPLGALASINPQTGVISGIAPPAGDYVVSVIVFEYRSGVLIGEHRKDFILKVQACDFAGAALEPSYITCDGFSYSFSNLSPPTPLINSYYWDFGVTTSTNDTSISATPTFTYPDTGIFSIKLVVNRGEACSDSATSTIAVYPGFFPGFDFNGVCVNRPTQFTDTTNTQYGVVDSWRWDFGVTTVNNDTSNLQNPTWTFTQMGNYNVRFIVTNSKGCVDTVITVVPIIDKPPLDLAFRDTLICNIDNIQLGAIGSGAFSWTPLTNIVNANTATPTVNPQATTWYHVLLDDNGCLNNDSVRVRVVNQVTLAARADTVICATDAVQLSASTDGFQYSWTPAADLNDPNILNPVATPTTTTTYQITSRIGSCVATDDVTVTTVPYPIANAGPDETICFAASAQLNGSVNGSSFTWTPSITLDDPNVLDPIAAPFQTTEYILSSFDTQGCPKPGRDTVIITVLPQINAFAGNDTIIVIGQPLQLNASGGTTYLWSPPTGLSAIDISDPVAILDPSIDSIRYRVIISNVAGCFDSAFINVRVFKTNPYIFVPTAFTPNNDGRNDVIRPIAVGMKQIEYFRVYNRWGQMVFSTQINGHGWDGRIGGTLQSTGVFVWLVKGVDYLDRPFFQKGTVTLIR